MKPCKQNILVISSFACDKITYLKSGKNVMKHGGPAFWISKTLQDLEVKFDMLTSKKEAKIEITIDEFEEKGTIQSVDKILLKKKKKANFILISTIANEFELDTINNLKGDLIIDIQGYVRYSKIHNRKFLLPENIAKRIKILKATEEEFVHLGSKFINAHQDIILLITKGKNGADIVASGKKYFFPTPKIKPNDTIGAGDVFLTAFVTQFIRGENINDSGKFAVRYTSRFLKKKTNSILL